MTNGTKTTKPTDEPAAAAVAVAPLGGAGYRQVVRRPQGMNIETKQLLTRWQSLERNDGLRRAGATARRLWIIGLILCIVVVFALVYRLHPALIAGLAAAMGWVIAESNALRTRLAQWPIVKSYIDWKKVEEDLKG